jgi:peptidoglycan-N-acetylglucosamine deacetylase
MMTLSILGTVLACLLASAAAAIAYPRVPLLLLRRLWPRIVWQGASTSRAISLTFDDGPDPVFTPQVLALLREYGVRATFFLAGERARAYPSLVQAICEGGHEVANHSDSWCRTASLPLDRFQEDLLAAEATLARVPCFVKIFRPAGILVRANQINALTRLGYQCVLGSVYAFDPHKVPTWLIVWLIRRALRAGTIIVLHDSGGNRSRSIRAVPSVIAHARQLDLEFVPLSKLLSSPPLAPVITQDTPNLYS